ncbi:SURF1 family protein [Nocardioides sp. cx-169]|uniref:SURF1 family protein n=1 Tax=Nocardioides sp. cx-169 TaxID=2899080 RepID=UPI001E3B7545|nr:SURF1 family protein [Nocardioides sp. cx-169]MCD4533095.1 SURF1 family protein [Nocardioides sp. cx-169]
MRAFLTPRMIGAHLLALVCVGIAGGLGVWQFDAWQRTRAAEAKDLTQVDPVPLTDVMGSDDPFPPGQVGHPVEVSGTWLPDSTVFVSGREVDGVEGFWVVTPLAVGDADAPALPVVRGWSRTTEGVPAPPTGTADLVAWLQPTEGTGQVDDDPRDDVLPQMRTGDLVQHVDQDLYGAYGVATEPLDGLEPATLEQLPSPGSLTGLRNFLYALEWWVFGAFAAFIWWRYVREESLTPEPEIAEDRVRSEV